MASWMRRTRPSPSMVSAMPVAWMAQLRLRRLRRYAQLSTP